MLLYPVGGAFPVRPFDLASQQAAQLVQVGEQVGRASLGTAAGPPALGQTQPPHPGLDMAAAHRNLLSPSRTPMGSEEE